MPWRAGAVGNKEQRGWGRCGCLITHPERGLELGIATELEYLWVQPKQCTRNTEMP